MTAGHPRMRLLTMLLSGALALAGCGGGERQDADEAEGEFRVEVVEASFPETQSIAQETTLKISVRNADDRTLPNVAVTVETEASEDGGSPSAFGQTVGDSRQADPNRPVWILDVGPKGGTSAYANTWSLGRLVPNQSKTFEWKLTAVKPGRYTIGYRVSPGLDGKARLAKGGNTSGSFDVTISDEPVPARVNDDGEVVRGEKAGGGDAGAGEN